MCQEIQSAHFGASNLQATLHTGVICMWLMDISHLLLSQTHCDMILQTYGLIFNLSYMNWRKTIQKLQTFISSDGPTTQYHNEVNFYLFSCMLYQMGFEAGMTKDLRVKEASPREMMKDLPVGGTMPEWQVEPTWHPEKTGCRRLWAINLCQHTVWRTNFNYQGDHLYQKVGKCKPFLPPTGAAPEYIWCFSF